MTVPRIVSHAITSAGAGAGETEIIVPGIYAALLAHERGKYEDPHYWDPRWMKQRHPGGGYPLARAPSVSTNRRRSTAALHASRSMRSMPVSRWWSRGSILAAITSAASTGRDRRPICHGIAECGRCESRRMIA